jgi:hypothetical protein
MLSIVSPGKDEWWVSGGYCFLEEEDVGIQLLDALQAAARLDLQEATANDDRDDLCGCLDQGTYAIASPCEAKRTTREGVGVPSAVLAGS